MTTTTPKIHVWWSAGGGVGKTTLAIMQAAALARQVPGQVALIDFKEATPHVHRYLGLKQNNLMPLFDGVERGSLSFELVHSHMHVKHGISVLTGIGLKEFTRFAETHFESIINSCKVGFQYIVVDVNGGIFFSSTLATLGLADFINVVTLPQISCLQDTKEMIDFLQLNWGVPAERFNYYLNKAGGLATDVVLAEFDALIGKTIKIPETKEIARIAAGSSPLVPEAELLLPAGCQDGGKSQGKRGLKILGKGRKAAYANKSF